MAINSAGEFTLGPIERGPFTKNEVADFLKKQRASNTEENKTAVAFLCDISDRWKRGGLMDYISRNIERIDAVVARALPSDNNAPNLDPPPPAVGRSGTNSDGSAIIMGQPLEGMQS